MTGQDHTRAHVWISGRVQGVAFRASTRAQARAVGVGGWVRNLVDGRVEAVFEGPRPAVEQMVAWCHRGPPYAHVDDVDVAWEQPTGKETSFRVA